MRVRPVATPALGWALAPFLVVIATSGFSAAVPKLKFRSSHNAAEVSESITAALSTGNDEQATKAWQQLSESPIDANAESADSSAHNAILMAGKTMAARGGIWRQRCAALAKNVASAPDAAPGSEEVARRLMRLATSSDSDQPRTAATIASASMP
jgi:hypothetical protein